MNKELVLKENFAINYSQMNCDLSLKPYALFNLLQDIASTSAENLGFGYTYMTQNNLGWFLIKYRMEFSEYPINVKNLTLETIPRGYNKLFAYRGFKLFQGEKLLGKVFSCWSVIDLNTRSLVLVQNAIQNENMPPYTKNEEDLAFSKIKPLSKVDYKKEFKVRYNDLDVNMHANNGNYAIWSFEVLPFDFINNHNLKAMDFVFKKEAKYDETIISEVEIIENKTIHRLKNINNEDLCLIECEWIKK